MEVGEIIQLGHHRLMCGDAFNPEHVDALMQGENPDMLYCDPPYGIRLDTRYQANRRISKTLKKSCANRPKKDYPAVIGDDSPFNPSPLVDRFTHCPEQFWWGAENYAMHLPGGGSWLVWDKRPSGTLDNAYGSVFELCWSRKRHKRNVVRITWCGVAGMGGVDGLRFHPTQKPVRVAEWFLDRYSKEGATIMDLFGGAGGTLLACERKGRACRMMELSPDYCQVIIDRYETMTQQQSLGLEKTA